MCPLLAAAFFLTCLAMAPQGRAAEEAWRGDGRRLRGELSLDGGELRFTPSGGAAVPLADLARVRFSDAPPEPFRAGGGRRVRLRDGQVLTGQLLGIDGEKVLLRTAWAARLELPRAAVAGIDPLPGWRLLVWEDSPGDKYQPRLARPLPAGRVGVNFRAPEGDNGKKASLTVQFRRGAGPRRLTVTVAGGGPNYLVEAGGLAGTTREVARTPGWHRLAVQFSPRSLRVTCDDDVLWYDLENGPGGPLEEVTLQSPSDGGGPAVRWEEFSVERAADEFPRPPAEAGQDEVRLADDDQLFGRVVGADRHAVHVEGRFGKRSLPWTRVAGCSFRRADAPPDAHKGATVRLRLRSGLCAEDDVLEGTVTALDGRRLTLRHALLGEVALPRGRVREVRPLPAGRR